VAAASDPEAGRRARELLDYLVANRDGLEDYRRRVKVEGLELRGLGGIEGITAGSRRWPRRSGDQATLNRPAGGSISADPAAAAPARVWRTRPSLTAGGVWPGC